MKISLSLWSEVGGRSFPQLGSATGIACPTAAETPRISRERRPQCRVRCLASVIRPDIDSVECGEIRLGSVRSDGDDVWNN